MLDDISNVGRQSSGKRPRSNSNHRAKRRRSENIQSIKQGHEPLRKRTRSISRRSSRRGSAATEPVTGTIAVQSQDVSSDRRPSELAAGITHHSPVVYHHENPSDAPVDDNFTRFPSLHRAGHSRSSQRDKFGSDQYGGPGLSNFVPEPTIQTTNSTAAQKSIDSRDPGVRIELDDNEHTDITVSREGIYGNPHVDHAWTASTYSSTSSTHPHQSELAGSSLSPVGPRPVSSLELVQRQQVTLSTYQPQTTLTISPILSPTAPDAETTLRRIHEKLTLLLLLCLSFSNTVPAPTAAQSTTPTRESEAETQARSTETRKKKELPSRWSVVYLLILGYLLFSIWLARAEWLDANGMGGVWGVQTVRGGHGRWVWGLYTG